VGRGDRGRSHAGGDERGRLLRAAAWTAEAVAWCEAVIFAQDGKPLFNGSATLVNGSISATLYAPISTVWTDVYSIVITSNDTAVELITISDGTLSLLYYVGGTTSNVPVMDQASIPYRMKRGQAITVTANAVAAGKTTAVNIRGLVSST
jgi:hypothetical protein